MNVLIIRLMIIGYCTGTMVLKVNKLLYGVSPAITPREVLFSHIMLVVWLGIVFI